MNSPQQTGVIMASIGGVATNIASTTSLTAQAVQVQPSTPPSKPETSTEGKTPVVQDAATETGGVYTAVASVNTSTIRGTNVNITA